MTKYELLLHMFEYDHSVKQIMNPGEQLSSETK